MHNESLVNQILLSHFFLLCIVRILEDLGEKPCKVWGPPGLIPGTLRLVHTGPPELSFAIFTFLSWNLFLSFTIGVCSRYYESSHPPFPLQLGGRDLCCDLVHLRRVTDFQFVPLFCFLAVCTGARSSKLLLCQTGPRKSVTENYQ